MKISIILIGHNTINELKNLLVSINRLNYDDACEVVYVDDGSTDQSYRYFKAFNLKFLKRGSFLTKQKGRVFARQKAVELSSGDWLCFINSNVIVDSNLLLAYKQTIKECVAVAFAGVIVYKSLDVAFENYLNNVQRGLNSYKHKQKIHFKNLLFGNCIIKKTVFTHISLNLKMTGYGGVELDFANQLFEKFPNMLFANKKALVTRVGHSAFPEHCKKLIEYGKINFNHLSFKLQKEVVKCRVFLKIPLFLNKIFSLVLFFCLKVYKIQILNFHYVIIRLGMLCSILTGYYYTRLKGIKIPRF